MLKLSRHQVMASVGFTGVVLLQTADWLFDPDILPLQEIAVDSIIMLTTAIGVGAAFFFVSRILPVLTQSRGHTHKIQYPSAPSVSQKQDLSRLTNHDFHHWRLSAAECEIAIEMLRGYSHKEIANKRDATVATVRQQSQSIYRKSGLSNRAMFCAHFLACALEQKSGSFHETVMNEYVEWE